MRRLALLAIVAACGGHRRPAPPPAECARLVEHVVDLVLGMVSQLPPVLEKSVDEGVPAYRKALMESCANDHWSDASIACIAAAKSAHDAQACDASFSPDQKTHVAGAYATLMGGTQRAVERWTEDTLTIINRACACTDAACHEAASRDFARAMVKMRANALPDMAAKLDALDAKAAACNGSGSGSAK